MPRDWLPIPLTQKLSLNADETAIANGMTEIENGYVTEQGNHSRFPRLSLFASLNDFGRVYLNEWRGDLVAATSYGRFYRITRDGVADDRTGLIIGGGNRIIFAQTEDELAMCAGGDIVRFAGDRTEILDESGTAPKSTHVGYIDGYLVAIELDSGRFRHSQAGLGRQWNSLDLFAANGSPDNLTALTVTPYRELLLCGPRSVEQFERLSGGDLPFFRRWTMGTGISTPYMLTFANGGVYSVSELKEVTKLSGQQPRAVGDEIGRVLQKVQDWTDAWMGGFPDQPLHIRGQKFLILQIPHEPNPYGTKGLTFLYDYRLGRFSRLYGSLNDNGVPTRYPAWSHWSIWGRHFVGGEGIVYELVI